MKKIAFVLIVSLLFIPTAFGQYRHQGRPGLGRPGSNGFYVLLGGTKGPTFSDFISYMNNTYHPTKPMKNFGSNVSVSIGYISRFHRNFGLDVGFSIYGLRSVGDFPDTSSAIPESMFRHELDYLGAVFTATLPILFEFSPKQPVVPYIGIGISIFSMRLDDYYDVFQGNTDIYSDALRDTRTAVGGHFEAGVNVKINRRIWIDLRGRWHNGSGHLATYENNFADFSIKQNISQYSLGIDYFFY
jgi:hypothetical protein